MPAEGSFEADGRTYDFEVVQWNNKAGRTYDGASSFGKLEDSADWIRVQVTNPESGWDTYLTFFGPFFDLEEFLEVELEVMFEDGDYGEA